jgi:protein TonB
MKRLQTKCILVSAGLHLLLAVILVVGPAFLTSRSKVDDMKTLDFVPAIAIDQAFSGGGNPKAQLPPPTPTATPPAPQVAVPAPPPPPPPAVHQPEPATVPIRETKPDPDAIASEKSTPKHHEIKLTPVVRRATNENSRQPSESDRQAKELADSRLRAAEAIGRTARNLSHDLSPSTSIDTNYGPGGGGEAYANYGQIVKSIYEREWIAPEDAANDDAITKVTVTIARDGTVMSSRIVRGSGDSSVDGSVQRTLDRVTFIAPFPEGSKDKERTYTINFNLKAKRLSG